MKITYDSTVDALSIVFHDAEVITEHVAEGVAFDYDAKGHLAGIEILDAGKLTGDIRSLCQVDFQEYRQKPAAKA
jgi:YD repeat-containing protein